MPISTFNNSSQAQDRRFGYAGSIAQQHHATTEYYLADALGSVRQLTDSAGEVVLARSYDPYGSLVENNGYDGVSTAYGYTGEYTDYYIKLIYLRSRYYSPTTGRFFTKDVWIGDSYKPFSLNKWVYVEDNPVNNNDPTGYCSHTGWNDSQGIFTKTNCDRLESGDLEFTESWYYSFADYVENDLPQTATNLRHYLNGSGSELQLDSGFMKNKILGLSEVKDEINNITTWYVRKNIIELNECQTLPIGPVIFANAFTPPYIQAWIYWPFDKSQLDISGSLGSFRLDLEISGGINNYQSNLIYNTVDTNLKLHVVVLDYYNWHKGLGVSYKGNAIDDEWADNLSKAGMAKEFLVRGDVNINFIESINSLLFGASVGDTPPGNWVYASCIGSQFDVDQEGPGQIDYCGNPMK